MNIDATILVIDAVLRVALAGPDLPDDFGEESGAAAVELHTARDANLDPAPAAAPVPQARKPVLTVTLTADCEFCDDLKADIEAGRFAAYQIQYARPPSVTGVYPEIAYAQPSGVTMRRTGYRADTLQRIAADLAKPAQSQASQAAPARSSQRMRKVCRNGVCYWVPVEESPQPVAVWQGQTYSAPVCNRPGCTMCNAIRSQLSSQRWQSAVEPDLPPGQQPTDPKVLGEILNALELTPDDVFADLGCGDGRVLVAAVRASGCRAVGVEIDEDRAKAARAAVAAAGLSDRIEIVTGDARHFDLAARGVNKLAAFLWPELLEELRPTIGAAEVAVTPFHKVPGLPMRESGNVWIYRT